jgi:hypothetical protein
MGNYTINKRYITKSADFIIEVIKTKLTEDGCFVTSTGKGKKYTVKRISSTGISYVTADRNQDKSEVMDIEELKTAVEEMKKLPSFSTDAILLKERLPSNLYRKRTPLFGLLTYTEILLEI